MGKSGYLDIKILSKGKGLPKRVSKSRCFLSSSEFDLTEPFENKNNDVFSFYFPLKSNLLISFFHSRLTETDEIYET